MLIVSCFCCEWKAGTVHASPCSFSLVIQKEIIDSRVNYLAVVKKAVLRKRLPCHLGLQNIYFWLKVSCMSLKSFSQLLSQFLFNYN